MTTKLLWILILVLVLTTPVYALEQTPGVIIINIPSGGNITTSYGLLNNENNTVTVKFDATGSVSKYISYPKELVLTPNKLTYVNITTSVPGNIKENKLTGFIYATKEGVGDGQVQINIRLGKEITVNIQDVTPETNTKVYDASVVYGIIVIGVLTVIGVLIFVVSSILKK